MADDVAFVSASISAISTSSTPAISRAASLLRDVTQAIGEPRHRFWPASAAPRIFACPADLRERARDRPCSPAYKMRATDEIRYRGPIARMYSLSSA